MKSTLLRDGLKPFILHNRISVDIPRVQHRIKTKIAQPQSAQLDLTFTDYVAAYNSKTNWEVIRAYLVLKLCSNNFLVDHYREAMIYSQMILGKRLFQKLMELTFYGHFVAGADQVSIQPKVQRLRSFGVTAILDYSAEEDLTHEEAEKLEMESCVPHSQNGKEKVIDEFAQYRAHEEFADRRVGVSEARTFFYLGEASCEKNMINFLQSIEAVSKAAKGGDSPGFAAIKITALGRPQLLLQLSEVIARVHKYVYDITGKEGRVIEQGLTREDLIQRFSKIDPKVQNWLDHMTYDSTGLIHLLPWQSVIDARARHPELSRILRVADLNTGKMTKLMPPLDEEEEEMFHNMMRRIHKIFKTAKSLRVPVMVDAEQSYFQPAISRITVEMMRIYNQERPIVYNTYQCYLKKALRYLMADLEQAERQGFHFGAKIVRGAYMDQERLRAKVVGYEDPINPNYEATNKMYEDCLEECMRRIRFTKERGLPKWLNIVAATHNEDTVRFAIEKMKEYEIAPEEKSISFGQLYGMCDQVSFPLGQSGYSVFKYVPYGPVGEVMPYLSRRAHENRHVLGKVSKERSLLLKEIRRRILHGQLMFKPKGPYLTS